MQLNNTKTPVILTVLDAACTCANARQTGTYMGISAGRSAATIDDARIKSGLLGLGFGTTSISDRERDSAWKL